MPAAPQAVPAPPERTTMPFAHEPTGGGELLPTMLVTHHKQYTVREAIGEGGMGRIYRAYDPILDRSVALKVMKPDIPGRARDRFRQEAIYGARLGHPGICRVFDLGVLPSSEVQWFAMEYLVGKDLERIMSTARNRGVRLALTLVVELMDQILAALDYSHCQRIVHRDVKPANLFVVRQRKPKSFSVKLLDYGVAVDLDDPAVEREICGDPRYMAPEQSILGGQIDGRADIYAAGMCLYELATGRHAYEELMDAPVEQILGAHLAKEPPPPSQYLPNGTAADVACALDVVFAKACAKDPGARFATAEDMRRSVMQIVAG